ncbi:MAG: aminoacyl-tRNA hydrolase [Patescibacteria group bacterium]
MKLIVGLGNPGKEYEKTRHNVGFQCVDLLQQHLGFPAFKVEKKFASQISEGSYQNHKVILAKPETFMNNSGEALQKLVNFYHIEPQDAWVIYDDVDLPLGSIRIRTEGSSGTHNGMKSIISLLGFQNFPRIRIGIESRGESSPQKQDLASFVLHAFSKKEAKLAKETLQMSKEAIMFALEKGIPAAMDQYNSLAIPPKSH